MATYDSHKAGTTGLQGAHSSVGAVRIVNGQGVRPPDRYGRRNDRASQKTDRGQGA